MKVEAIEITFFAGDIASIRLTLISLGPWNPIIVTDSDGKAINNIDCFGIELLPGVSSKMKQRQKESLETMKSTVQTTTTQHVGDLARRAQEGTRGFKVAAKEHHGDQARRDDFRIAHLVVQIFGMTDGV